MSTPPDQVTSRTEPYVNLVQRESTGGGSSGSGASNTIELVLVFVAGAAAEGLIGEAAKASIRQILKPVIERLAKRRRSDNASEDEPLPFDEWVKLPNGDSRAVAIRAFQVFLLREGGVLVDEAQIACTATRSEQQDKRKFRLSYSRWKYFAYVSKFLYNEQLRVELKRV